VVQRTHSDFVRPVEKSDILESLARVPKRFIADIYGIFLLSGSSKQAKVAEKLFCYGTYWGKCIFLAPFPKRWMTRIYRRRKLSPSVLREFQRAGAQVEHRPQGITVIFNRASLREFYLRDVLMHEIGHHVDRHQRRSKRKEEGFANWVASEYGYKLKPRHLTTD
jgi:hypothetical protein